MAAGLWQLAVVGFDRSACDIVKAPCRHGNLLVNPTQGVAHVYGSFRLFLALCVVSIL